MFILNEKYHEGITINPYEDSRSLVLTQAGNDGKEYVQWCKREMGQAKKIVNRPVGLTFESEAQLKEFATWLMSEVNGTQEDNVPEFMTPDDDVPF